MAIPITLVFQMIQVHNRQEIQLSDMSVLNAIIELLLHAEEMYAAIDDASDGNYMQIPDGERPTRPSWLGKI